MSKSRTYSFLRILYFTKTQFNVQLTPGSGCCRERRGDVGPYNGSTAGFAKKSAKSDNNGGDIRNFFNATSKAKSKTEEKTDNAHNDVQSTSSNDAEVLSPELKEVSAYGVWVSEIMLQQTRVEAVIPYYLKWMTSFPTVEILADATPDQVNSHWAGLGFYRRARLLHQGAKRVVEEYGGVVPNTVEELMNVCCVLFFVSILAQNKHTFIIILHLLFKD